jgi:hypothetical protein
VNEPGKAGSSGGPKPVDPVLRAKYLDYCSARVAEVLVRLSADEMYVLAQEVAQDSRLEPGDFLSYDEIVRLATWRLSQTIPLPTVHEFGEAYREDPERFEQEMLGLWEGGVPEEG